MVLLAGVSLAFVSASSVAVGGSYLGAGGGNRTRTASLEGWNSAIELHPLYSLPPPPQETSRWWRGLDLNQRRRAPTDLQSVPFSRSGTPPCFGTPPARGRKVPHYRQLSLYVNANGAAPRPRGVAFKSPAQYRSREWHIATKDHPGAALPANKVLPAAPCGFGAITRSRPRWPIPPA